MIPLKIAFLKGTDRCFPVQCELSLLLRFLVGFSSSDVCERVDEL